MAKKYKALSSYSTLTSVDKSGVASVPLFGKYSTKSVAILLFCHLYLIVATIDFNRGVYSRCLNVFYEFRLANRSVNWQ
ncbi:MAG: hypothetical protein R2771_11185 [Saprospiraceae bacterium]